MLTVKDLPIPPAGKHGWPWTDGTPPLATRRADGGRWPRITIVTPSFNQAQFLEETLRSILLQGYPELEHIVMDGGSRDGSVEVIQKYGKFLTRWASERDRGQTDALNKGFARATGEIRGFINSDDLLEPGALQAVAAEFLSGHEWIAGHCRFLQQGVEPSFATPHPHETLLDWCTTDPFTQPSVFWSRRIQERVGEFRLDMQYQFDWEYWLRCWLEAQAKPHVLPRVLSVYRLHEDSKTVAQSDRMLAEMSRVRAMYQDRLNAAERAELKRRVGRLESVSWQNDSWRLFKLSRRKGWRAWAKAVLAWPGNRRAWRLGFYYATPDLALGALRRVGWWR